MRTLLDDVLKRGSDSEQLTEDTEVRMYLDLWYGCLMPVIEGWRELALQDDHVDALLNEGDAAGYVAALQRHRNGTFHFQHRYWDDRFKEFPKKGPEAVVWVRALTTQFGRWFLETMRADRQ